MSCRFPRGVADDSPAFPFEVEPEAGRRRRDVIHTFPAMEIDQYGHFVMAFDKAWNPIKMIVITILGSRAAL